MPRKSKAQREHEQALAKRREKDRARREKAKREARRKERELAKRRERDRARREKAKRRAILEARDREHDRKLAARRVKHPKRPAKPPSKRVKAKAPTKREVALEAQLDALKRELAAERAARKEAESKVPVLTDEEKLLAKIHAATKRKADRERAERVKRFGPIADLAARRMRAWLDTVGLDPEVTSNGDASADGYAVIPWQGNIFDTYLLVSRALEDMPADYWFSFRASFIVPDSRKVKTRLRRSDIEAAPYRRATYWRRANRSFIASAANRIEDIAKKHESMGSVVVDLAIAIHWNPDNLQPNRYSEGQDTE